MAEAYLRRRPGDGNVTWAKYALVAVYGAVPTDETVSESKFGTYYFGKTYTTNVADGTFTVAQTSSATPGYASANELVGKYYIETSTSSATKTGTTLYYIEECTSTSSSLGWVARKYTFGISGYERGDFIGYIKGKEGEYPDNGEAGGFWYVKQFAAEDFDPVFANNEWGAIIAACQQDVVPDTWTVGNQKTMTINGTNYTIDIIGKYHDAYADGSTTAPLTFQLHELYTTTYKMNDSRTNTGGWDASVMRSTHLPAIMALMPTEVQSAIRNVKKLTAAGGTSTQIVENADKLFLLSEFEVFGTTTYSTAGEGSQYAYYAAGNSRVKKVNGSANIWNLRSPRKPSNTTQFCNVDASGALVTNYANIAYGVSFAFCF